MATRDRLPNVAKIMRPDPSDVLPRVRLFRRIEESTAPVLWIVSSPGSGKTTLAASYAVTRGCPLVWYRLDSGDADLASFFYYLGLAARQAATSAGVAPLPLLTPEYLADVAGFTRRYFRDLYARLGSPFLLVMDDYHEVPEGSPLHGVVRDGLAELPHGGRALVLSRTEPPAAFARLRASRAISLLTWDDLRLTPEESQGIARLHLEGEPSATGLHESTGGWVAGLVLLIERLKRDGRLDDASRPLPSEATFDYFAGEIFRGTDPETQTVLLTTAVLPKTTAPVAVALTGSPRAGQIVSDMARRHYFTTRHPGAEPWYEYHPLFRAFLLHRAAGAFGTDALARLRREAAALLEAAGQVEDAVGLLHEAGDLEGVADLVERHAPRVAAQGRHRTLAEWIGRLPGERVASRPWLLYWTGACRIAFAPGESGEAFGQAFDGFRARRDRIGALLAWSGAVESIWTEGVGYDRLDAWMARLGDDLSQAGADLPLHVEAGVTMGMITCLTLRRPDHPDAAAWRDRAHHLLSTIREPGLRLGLGFHLAVHQVWRGDLAAAAVLVDGLREAARSRDAAPAHLLAAGATEALHAWVAGNFEACRRAVDGGLAVADATGVDVWSTQILAQGVAAALSAGDRDAAAPLLRRMAACLPTTRPLDVGYYHLLAAWDALLGGDLSRAASDLAAARRSVDRLGWPLLEAIAGVGTGVVLHAQGHLDAAAAALAEALPLARRAGSRLVAYALWLAQAHLALDRDQHAEARARLTAALALGREHGYVTCHWWRAPAMARLCVEALRAGIEPDYVRGLVRARRLVPDVPPRDVDAWPWPVRVVTLGRFELYVDDRRVSFSGKVQRRPLDILKLLVASGDTGLSEAVVEEALWPDADGDLSRRALGTALYRLRRLIGHDAAVHREGGRLSLDARLCFTDAEALDALLDEAEARREDLDAAREAAGRAERLYRGPFLPGDDALPHVASRRERLRSRLLRFLADLGRRLEAAGARDEAIDTFERALDVDDCAEEVYRSLMRGYAQLGRHADLRAAYHRCRRALATRLHVEPTAETSALYRTLERP